MKIHIIFLCILFFVDYAYEYVTIQRFNFL